MSIMLTYIWMLPLGFVGNLGNICKYLEIFQSYRICWRWKIFQSCRAHWHAVCIGNPPGIGIHAAANWPTRSYAHWSPLMCTITLVLMCTLTLVTSYVNLIHITTQLRTGHLLCASSYALVRCQLLFAH